MSAWVRGESGSCCWSSFSWGNLIETRLFTLELWRQTVGLKLYELNTKGLYSWQIEKGRLECFFHKMKWMFLVQNWQIWLQSSVSHLNYSFLQLFSSFVKWYFVTVQNGENLNYANRNWWRLHLRSERLQQFPLSVCLVSWLNSAALITVNHFLWFS